LALSMPVGPMGEPPAKTWLPGFSAKFRAMLFADTAAGTAAMMAEASHPAAVRRPGSFREDVGFFMDVWGFGCFLGCFVGWNRGATTSFGI
jgi:hypothetical protein